MTRVLVVEDEESYSDALAYMLRKEGYEVAITADGNTALTEFDRFGPDIVLLDLMLPGIPGTEVCRQLRARGQVPIIMVTARDTEIDKVVGLELGADDYLTKPFALAEVEARLLALHRRSTGAVVPTESRAGPLRIDRRSRQVRVGDTLVRLMPRSMLMLERLIEYLNGHEGVKWVTMEQAADDFRRRQPFPG